MNSQTSRARSVLGPMAFLCLILFVCPLYSKTEFRPNPSRTETRTVIRLGFPGIRWFDYESRTAEDKHTTTVYQAGSDAKNETKAPAGSVRLTNINYSHHFNVWYGSPSWLFLVGAIVLLVVRSRLPRRAITSPSEVDQPAPAAQAGS